MHSLPTSEAEIDEFIAAFEAGTLPKERWTHGAHIFPGACYVHRLGEATAIDQMRTCIRRYNEAVGGKNTETSGYHETVTLLWIKILHRFRSGLPASETSMNRTTFAALAVEKFAHDREILRRFYDFDVIGSTEARRTWVPPNLCSLDRVEL
jgi:hypothetical protein